MKRLPVWTVDWRHCSFLERENAIRWPCPEPATVTYVDRDGVRVGFCAGHGVHAHFEAAQRGWVVEEWASRAA